MDSAKSIKRSKRIIHVLFGIALAIVSVFAIGCLYLEALSPAQLFVNDTEQPVNAYLLGASSPGIHIDVAPGESQLVDMPSWWGKPNFPRTADGERVKPRWNLIVFKVYNLSDFPEDWQK